MAVAQNECYRVVTIGYLKNFIKDGNESLIKDSNGNSVNILREDDTYCPGNKVPQAQGLTETA